MANYPVVYNKNFKKLGILERAYNIGYEKRYNELWQGRFTLPADDPKNRHCRPLYFVELFDSGRVDLFRILPRDTVQDPAGQTRTYRLEHVLATLMDSVMFRYHEVGGIGMPTADVLEYILQQQDYGHWELGAVDISRQFQYSWENENLLAALFSVPRPFDEEYRWTWRTTGYPWTLNLRHPDDVLESEIRYQSNMEELRWTEDPTNLCTRIYPLGQGEGVNQLNIANVNPTGEPYIDADTQGEYGIVSRVWVDRRFESEESLFESAKAILEDLKIPRMEIAVSAADLYQITRIPIHNITIGKPIKVTHDELGIFYTGRIVTIEKPDVNGNPGEINLEITNRPQDVSGTLADLANRSRINEVYSQGATNIDSHQIADNCDPNNPVIIKFHIPTEAVFVNKVLLNYDTSAFRAYSKAIKDDGSIATTTADGGATTTTSGSGGATTQTSSSGGGQTSSSSGAHSHTISGQTASGTGSHRHSTGDFSTTLAGGRHRHWVSSTGAYTGYFTPWHVHDVTGVNTTYDGWHSHSVTGTTSSSASNHTHSVSNHTHSVSIPNHSHSVSIGNHSHSISIPAHSHGIDYGIYNGPTPAMLEIKVDGSIVSDLGLQETEVNITDYLSRDSAGRIVRGFHEVAARPIGGLGRVNIAVHIQQFIQSRGDLQL